MEREKIIVVQNIDTNMQHQKGLFPTKKGANPTICRKEELNPTKRGSNLTRWVIGHLF